MSNLNDRTFILIDKFHSGQATADEISHLQTWKNSSANNLRSFNELISLLELVSNLKDWKQFDRGKAWSKFQSKINGNHLKISWKIYSIAAMLLLVLTATIGNFNSIFDGTAPEYISGSDEKFSILSDGSEIFHIENSKIFTSDFSEKSRVLTSEGSYFVNVKHDKINPFIINTQQISIEVLGTSFKVEEKEDETRVKVRDGKVLITSGDGARYTIEKDEMLVFSEGNVKVSKLNDEDWGLYTNEFNDETLFNLISELSENFGNVKINASAINPECRITTKIEEATIIEILEEIDLLFDVDYTIKKGTIIVNNISC